MKTILNSNMALVAVRRNFEVFLCVGVNFVLTNNRHILNGKCTSHNIYTFTAVLINKHNEKEYTENISEFLGKVS